MIARIVDRRDQLAQRFDRVVDRVCDRAGDVFGHGRLHGQIAVREARQLVEQPQNRFLVAFVLARLDFEALAEVAAHLVAAAPQHERDQRRERAGRRSAAAARRRRRRVGDADAALEVRVDLVAASSRAPRWLRARRASIRRADGGAHLLAQLRIQSARLLEVALQPRAPVDFGRPRPESSPPRPPIT